MVLPLLPVLALAAEFAPSVVRWIGGDKAGDVADRVASTAQAITGTASPDAAAAALRADPALAMQFRTRMAELDAELERAYLADRENARARDIAIVQAGRRNVRADLMVAGAALILVACLACLVLLRDALSGEAVGIISTIAGISGKCLSDAFNFEFGSSRGSQIKTDLLAAGK